MRRAHFAARFARGLFFLGNRRLREYKRGGQRVIWLVKRGISVDWLYVKGSKNIEVLKQKAEALIASGQVAEEELRLRDDRTGSLYPIDFDFSHDPGRQGYHRR